MRVEYGVPGLPKPRLEEHAFKETLSSVLRNCSDLNVDQVWQFVTGALGQRHGTMVVVSDGAREEALRLASQATPIQPTTLGDYEMIRKITAIDGAVLLDPSGVCHAIGVILDGLACATGTPARGARFNSAVRYVDSTKHATVAVVISEDGGVDVRTSPDVPSLA